MNILVDVLEVRGALDNNKGKSLLTAVENLTAQEESSTFLLDLTQVKFIDSAGLGALVKVLKATEAKGKRFVLCGIQSQVSMLLKLTRMESLFEIVSDRSALCDILNREVVGDRCLTPDKFNVMKLNA